MSERANVIVLAPLFYEGLHEVGETVSMLVTDIKRHVDAGVVVEGEGVSLDQPVELTTLEQVKALWDTEMSPSEYLKQFPEGPLSTLALQIVELEAERFEQE